jgi:hypothetical protein
VGGVGVRRFLGEETEKIDEGEGSGDQGLKSSALEIGEWSFRPCVCDCFYRARGEGNHLQNPGGGLEVCGRLWVAQAQVLLDSHWVLWAVSENRGPCTCRLANTG